MKKIKRNSKIILAFILGIILTETVVYAATTIMGSNVTYSNTKSGLKSTNVQGAIDGLYEKADAGKVINKADKFVAAYTYNQTSGASNYCVTGKEETCQKTTCYKTKTANSCPAGTIIKYKVNDTDLIGFNVLFDHGETMTMQSQRNTIYETEWYKDAADNSKGPMTILPILENITLRWDNVNTQTYTLGITSFSGKGAYTGCDIKLNCTVNSYTLPERTAKARMITIQEVKALGCTEYANSCFKFLNTDVYWLVSTADPTDSKEGACAMSEDGHIGCNYLTTRPYGARAVVEVNK